MKVVVDIKSVGTRYGTVGWLKKQISDGTIWFEESNNYYIPVWSSCSRCRALTHGLVIRDKDNRALIAYRNMDGDYKYNISSALGEGEEAHWVLNLTEAAIDALSAVCIKWISTIEEETEEKDLDELDINIQFKPKQQL